MCVSTLRSGSRSASRSGLLASFFNSLLASVGGQDAGEQRRARTIAMRAWIVVERVEAVLGVAHRGLALDRDRAEPGHAGCLALDHHPAHVIARHGARSVLDLG